MRTFLLALVVKGGEIFSELWVLPGLSRRPDRQVVTHTHTDVCVLR